MFEVKKDIFSKILESFSENYLLFSENRNWTFGEFFGESFQLSKYLDVEPKERVAVPAYNSENFLKILLALWFKKAIAVPLNSSLPVYKRKELITKVGCKENSFEEMLGIFSQHFPKKNFKNLYSIDTEKNFNFKINKEKISINTKAWGTIIFTSGSSGFEKAVVHSLGNHIYNALGSNAFEPLNQGDRWLLSLPLFHVGGLAIFFRILIFNFAEVDLVRQPERIRTQSGPGV